MPTRSAAVLASGTANAAKLFVAALAFTSAYVGLTAYSNAGTATGPARTVTLAARELPVTAPAGGHTVPARTGEITMSVLTGGAGCAKSYAARSLVVNPDPDQPLSYDWKLARWSPAAKAWRPYLSDSAGFAAPEQTVEWRPHISGNPGWYRVELTVEGAKTIRSDRFQVSC
ncbi:hypothetical protein AB0I81_18070 [Nonomuraea sp. NPDC050404]|uniref:hypothetical protein n=1 Tax=Nonomuraea sp. NPDC050404 TaxID=3155783 RepID=UPI003407CD05